MFHSNPRQNRGLRRCVVTLHGGVNGDFNEGVEETRRARRLFNIVDSPSQEVLANMGVPRAHSTRGQKGRRRSHLALKKLSLVSCSHCKKMIISHAVCKYCGYYKGKEVINVSAKELKKKEKKQTRK